MRMHSSSEPTSLTLDRYLAPAGSAAASFARLWESLWVQPYVSAELLEMCRLTLARLHQNEFELRAINPHLDGGALSQPRRASLQAGEAFRSPLFSAAEKSVLSFCECYGLDPQSIADEVADQTKAHLGEAGLVFLIEALGCIDGRIRTARCLRDLSAGSQTESADGR
jgi:hypothetical protein